jgi:hypothetical protein
MKKIITLIMILYVSTGFGQTYDTLIKYTFKDSTLLNGPFPDAGLTANLNNPITTKGGTNAISYTYTGATSKSARATGWDAGNGTKFWQIKVTTSGYNTLKLSSKQRSSGTGPKDFKVQYKIAYSGTWTDVPGATVLDSNNWTKGVLTNVAIPTACDNQDTVYLKWIMTSNTTVGNGTVAAGGASNIDDILVVGVSIVQGLSSYSMQPDVKMVVNKGTLTLYSNEPAKEISIFDISGNLVYNSIKTSSVNTVNTDKFNQGIYFINVTFDNNSTVTKKISLM